MRVILFLIAAAACREAPAAPAEPTPNGMVLIPGGRFEMGGEGEAPDSVPVHPVTLDSFFLDRTEVTNQDFARFVAATGYVTRAERAPTAAEVPGAPADALVAGSPCLHAPSTEVPLDDPGAWWHYRPGAEWRHPSGAGSSIDGLGHHPVVHIAWDDALAYCTWAGKRLPTEAEWEYASRGGTARQRFSWGEAPTVGGRWMANVFQGRFPTRDVGADGHRGTSPVGSFPPNGFGLLDMSGNAWEWCADWYRPDTYASSPGHDPRGPASGFDPDEPGVPKRVLRGGSFLCSEAYCYRFTNAARNKGAPDTGASNIGVRCARSAT